MGRKFVLSGTSLTNPSAPRLADVDQLESAGSLMLLEPMHPLRQWAPGVPAHVSKVPNLLADKAAPLIGSTLAADHDPTAASYRLDGVRAAAERSAKGGLHVAYSQKHLDNIDNTAAGFGSTGLRIDLTDPQKLYIATNYTHEFYMSLWMRVTRGAPAGVPQVNVVQSLAHVTSSTGNWWIHHNQTGTIARTGKTSTKWSSITDTGPKFAAGAGPYNPGNVTTPAASASSVLGYAFQVGNMGTFNSYLEAKQNAPSAVFYRAYLEDLTVSGRTYAEVQAMDNALYERQVLTEGGRYYNDTTTFDPATINV